MHSHTQSVPRQFKEGHLPSVDNWWSRRGQRRTETEGLESATSQCYTHIPDTRTRPMGLVNLKARMGWRRARWSVSRGNCRQPSVRPQRDSDGRKTRKTKAGRIQRRQPFLLPLPPLRLSCNITPEEPWQADTQNQFQTCLTPLVASPPSLPVFSSLCVFWYHLTLDSVAGDELTAGSSFSALLECEGSRRRGRGAGEVKGYWASTEEQKGEGCLSSGGVPVEGYLRGLEC